MKVVVTEAAWNDMAAIGRYIRNDNPNRADTFIDELYDQCQKLGHAPEAFQLVPGREETGIRRKRHGNYLIFYRISEDHVEIVHVLHGARDYEPLLFPED